MLKIILFTFIFAVNVLAKDYQPSIEEISHFYTSCLYENNGLSCHNIGAHFARNIKDEKMALKYYEKACGLHYRDSCVNIGNIRVKYLKSRLSGLKILKSECAIYLNQSNPSPTFQYTAPSPCLLFDVVNSNIGKSWLYIFKKYSQRYNDWNDYLLYLKRRKPPRI